MPDAPDAPNTTGATHADRGPGAGPDGPPIVADEERVASRAGLLPEEEQAGSDDPRAQAREILEDSDERTLDRGAAPSSRVEHRSSEDTVDPS